MYNIMHFGAAGDGETKDRLSIQKAIDACSQSGGGTVYIPAGSYLTGTIFLKSHVTVYLEAGAEIISSIEQEDFVTYPPVEQYEWKMNRCGLFYGKGLENVTVTGRGTIRCNDKAFWTPMETIGEGWNSTPPRYRAKAWRPVTILLEDCTNVLIQDITITNSPVYSGWFINCSRMNLQNTKVLNDFYGPNSDGYHFSSCSHVHISGCHFLTGDDSLAFDGNSNGPSENITVENCTFDTSVNVLRVYTGLDPGMTGEGKPGLVRNISMANCSVLNAAGVINVTAQNGVVEGLVFSNLTVNMEQEGTAVFLMTDRGSIRNVLINNVVARTNGACTIIGTKEDYIEDITLNHIKLDLYPKRKQFGLDIPDPIPSYAQHHFAPYNLYIRYARNIRLHEVDMKWFDTELAGAWSAIRCISAENISINGFRGRQRGNGMPAILLEDVKKTVIRNCQTMDGTETFVKLMATKKEEVRLYGNDTAYAGLELDVE